MFYINPTRFLPYSINDGEEIFSFKGKGQDTNYDKETSSSPLKKSKRVLKNFSTQTIKGKGSPSIGGD